MSDRLDYNYFRYYDPQTGRYITSDPIGILRDYNDPQFQIALETGSLEVTGFAGEELNHTYGYVGQNPLYWFDNYGLAKEHTTNKTPSNLPKHEKGEANKKQGRGGEKGDADGKRRPPRKRPDTWKGPWPPKMWFPPILDPCMLEPRLCNYENILPKLEC